MDRYNELKLSPESEGLTQENYYVFIQECLHIGSMILLERPNEQESFFESRNSYKKLEKVILSYMTSTEKSKKI